MDLEEILNLDIDKLKTDLLNKSEKDIVPKPEINFGNSQEHRNQLNIIPRNFRNTIIDFLQSNYHKDGKYPNINSIDRHTHISRLQNDHTPKTKTEWTQYLTSPEVEEILINRGLPTYDSHVQRIDLNFSLAVNLICDVSDKRSLPAKLKDAGLTTRQWTGFLKRKSHYLYFEERLNRVWNEEIEQKAKLAIARNVEAGDLTAIKYFHEYTDRFRPQDQQVLNLQIIITGLLEILAKHLNSTQLTAVAAELERTGLLNIPKPPNAIDSTAS